MDRDVFNIGKRSIGSGNKCYIIAEVAQAHDGSLGMAHSFIDAAVAAGADAVKFQTHIAEAESSNKDLFRTNFSYQDKTRFEYWRRMEFTEDQWFGLARHANEKGIDFLSTPFSVEAVSLLNNVGIPAWKISSGEIFNPLIFKALMNSRVPLIVSTGMNTEDEVFEMVNRMKDNKLDFALLQCTSMYPTPMDKIGLNVMCNYKNSFSCPVGLSDHSGSVFPGLAAMAKGANILEVHVTFDKMMFGPDTIASVTFSELKTLVEASRTFHIMDVNPVDKNSLAKELGEMRRLFGKSIIITRDLPKGTLISEEHLSARKPMVGISIGDINEVIGTYLKVGLSAGNFLKWEDIQSEEA